jgi:hypothetical protein
VPQGRLGFSVTADAYHVAIGGPGEAVGGKPFAGAVLVFRHDLTGSVPTFVAEVQQDASGVSDSAEPGDRFGTSVAIVPYRPVGAAAGVPDSLLVVGVPGEGVGGVADCGIVQEFLVTSTGFTELAALHQGSAGISGDNEAGDYFGHRVFAVNLNPTAEASATTVLVAVGSPGEDLGGVADAGTVHVFAGGTTTVTDTSVHRQSGGLPGTPGDRELVGAWLGGDGQYLLVPSPYGSRAVYAVPWSALTTGSGVPTVTYQPGSNGLPAGAVAFGIAVG